MPMYRVTCEERQGKGRLTCFVRGESVGQVVARFEEAGFAAASVAEYPSTWREYIVQRPFGAVASIATHLIFLVAVFQYLRYSRVMAEQPAIVFTALFGAAVFAAVVAAYALSSVRRAKSGREPGSDRELRRTLLESLGQAGSSQLGWSMTVTTVALLALCAVVMAGLLDLGRPVEPVDALRTLCLALALATAAISGLEVNSRLARCGVLRL